MKLKDATLFAAIGVTVSFLIAVVDGFSHQIMPIYLLRTAIFNIPLIIFLFTLYRNQP